MKSKELLQNIQDAYASLIDLPMIIIDSIHTSITSVSHINKLAELVIFSKEKLLQTKLQEEWELYCHLNSPAIINIQIPGLKAIIAPVVVNEQVECFIIAGPFLEQGAKRLIKEQCERKNERVEQWITAVEEASECTVVNIQEKLSHIRNMSEICARLIASEKQTENNLAHLKQLKDAMNELHSENFHIGRFLRMFQQLDHHIDFVVYAKRKNESCFVIDYIIGKQNGKGRTGKIFEADNPLLKRIVEEKQPLYLENLALELHIADFIEQGIIPKTLCAYPLEQNNKLAGIIFLGSQENNQLTQQTREACYLLVKLIEISFKYQAFESLIDKHLMRVSTLIEISKAMSMMNSADEILRIMTDLAVDLIQGDFSVVVLNNGEQIETNSGLIDGTNITAYCNDLYNRYFTENQEVFSSFLKLCQTNLGMVMECPFYVDKHVQGVLAVHIKSVEAIKEAEVYLSALTLISTVILQRIVQNGSTPSVPQINNNLLSDVLTSREMDVLRYLVEGHSNREIAEKLYISVHTVKNHITNIFQKLGVTDRSQVIAMVYQLNYAKPELK